jgi:hypothetical protein
MTNTRTNLSERVALVAGGTCGATQIRSLKPLEGHRVCLALRDGRRFDDCQLVSAGRASAPTLWLYTNGADAFVPVEDVLDVWEAA